jgi:hypothetical protein
MLSLGNSIKNFESAAKSIAPTAESMASTKKYSEELTLLQMCGIVEQLI